jgi:PhnB protein
MQTRLNPYLAFKDTARQSIEFYHTVFGGNLTVQTFKEAHTPTDDDLVMHAMLETDTGIVLMASDTPSGMEYKPGTNVSISLSGDNEAELRGYWDKLSEGATTTLPLEKAPWGDTFGMLTDKFGIQWMVNISAPKA